MAERMAQIVALTRAVTKAGQREQQKAASTAVHLVERLVDTMDRHWDDSRVVELAHPMVGKLAPQMAVTKVGPKVSQGWLVGWLLGRVTGTLLG